MAAPQSFNVFLRDFSFFLFIFCSFIALTWHSLAKIRQLRDTLHDNLNVNHLCACNVHFSITTRATIRHSKMIRHDNVSVAVYRSRRRLKQIHHFIII